MKLLTYALFFILLTINFLSCGSYLNRSTHVLFSKSHLLSAKSIIPNGIGFAQEFVFERSALANDQLNLSSWGGFNEVIWNTKTVWKEINLKAQIYNSYLWLFIIVDENKRIGFRLSKDSRFESGFYEMSADKHFINSEIFKNSKDISNLDIMNVKMIYQNNLLTIKINEKTYFEKPMQLKNQLFSLRSSFSGQVIVEDLVMYNTDGTQIIEDFSPGSQAINWFISFGFQIILAAALVILMKRAEFNLYGLFGIAAVGTTILVFWVWLDQTKISARYYNVTSSSWSGRISKSSDVALEVVRKRFLKYIYDITLQETNSFALDFKDYTFKFVVPDNTNELPEFTKSVFQLNGLESNSLQTRKKFIDQNSKLTLFEDFSELKNKNNQFQKIAFIGSSQMYGGGAANMESIFSSQVINELIKCSKKPVASVNISSPGDKIEYFLAEYKKLLHYWKPTLLVLSLGSNEYDLKVFYNSLKEMIELNKQIGAKTVFVKESNTLEAGKNMFADKYEVLDRLGAEYGLSILNLDDFINSPQIYDSGILWIDRAHFDRAGHNLTAKWLLEELKKQKVAGCW